MLVNAAKSLGNGKRLRPFSPEIAEIKKRWQAGHRWHLDIEALRVIHPGLRTLTDWLTESGAAAIRTHLTHPYAGAAYEPEAASAPISGMPGTRT